jgi:hypothetical protein
VGVRCGGRVGGAFETRLDSVLVCRRLSHNLGRDIRKASPDWSCFQDQESGSNSVIPTCRQGAGTPVGRI